MFMFDALFLHEHVFFKKLHFHLQRISGVNYNVQSAGTFFEPKKKILTESFILDKKTSLSCTDEKFCGTTTIV